MSSSSDQESPSPLSKHRKSFLDLDAKLRNSDSSSLGGNTREKHIFPRDSSNGSDQIDNQELDPEHFTANLPDDYGTLRKRASVLRSLQASPKKEDEVNFSEVSPQFFEALRNQADTGAQWTKRMASFSSKFAKIQESFSQELLKLVSSERKKLSMMKTIDEMESTRNAHLNFVERIGDLAMAHGQVAHGVMLNVVKSLEHSIEDAHAAIAEVVTKEKTYKESLQVMRSNIEKSKSRTLKAFDSAGIESGEHKKGDTLTRRSLIAIQQSISLAKRQKNQIKQVESAIEAANDHKNAVENANKFIQTFRTQNLPLLLHQIQISEENRIISIKHTLSEISVLILPLSRIYAVCILLFSCKLIFYREFQIKTSYTLIV
jgi:hypothetical protein